MKLVDNNIYIEWAEALVAGFPKSTLDNAKNRNSPSWGFLDDPDDKRKVLICFDKLKEDNQAKIVAKFGEPKKYLMLAPIRNLVKYDDKAEAFYLDYRYSLTPTLSKGEGAKALSREHVDKYTAAASFLNMLRDTTKDKRELKKLLNLTLEEFYDRVCEIISSDKIDLPTSYRRLAINEDSALKKYLREGYASLISSKFGNKIAAKINDEVSESVLLDMISHNYQFDDVIIANQYNIWARANNKKTITAGTVGVWRRKRNDEVAITRDGNKVFRKNFIPDVRGKRPSVYALAESDDNHLDILFKGYKRFYSIWVKDSFNDLPLGYSIMPFGTLNEGETIELIKEAWVNALYYVRYLTGENKWYLPHEVKTDRWGLKQLTPFYESIGHYDEPVAKSVNRGFIESGFGNVHWKRCQKMATLKEGNWSGNNVTAATRGVNMELLDKKKFNDIEVEGARQVAQFCHLLRHWSLEGEASLEQQWRDAWAKVELKDKREISDEQFLLKFGKEHKPKNGTLPRLKATGLDVWIDDTKYMFDIAGGVPVSFINKEVTVLYDRHDMSRVLITNNKEVRLMGKEATLAARSIFDWELKTEHYLNERFAEKMRAVKNATTKMERRKETLERVSIDSESLLQANVMVKELKQAAEHKQLMSMMGEDDYDILDQL